MSVSRGPLRIVLLRSGGYDYAELELHEALHLVAGNNVGKTSLIAALQFLYIDDSRQMHFSHDWSKTTEHYFPENGSLILFECMTPTGIQVFGLRGFGPVQGYDYERFAYSGAFDRNDYLDGRQPRPWDEVARRLVDRELRSMEPKHLRASLTGSGDARGAPLGLVPLKRSGTYESFRFLFRNLLRLSKIEQDHLKRLFIDICQPRLRKTEIDLRKEYAELFGQVERHARDTQALQQVAPLISELVGVFAEREVVRGRLASTWAAIGAALESERARVQAAVEAVEKQQALLTAATQALNTKQGLASAAGRAIATAQGTWGAKLEALEKLRDAARAFDPGIEAIIRQEAQSQYEGLVTRVEQATRADAAEVDRQLAEKRREITADQILVDRFSEGVVTWLRAQTGLDDRELSDLFGVLNPELLGEVLGDGRVDIVDAPAAVALLRGIHAKMDSEGFAAEGVRVRRRKPGARSPLDRYQDVAVVRERIRRARVLEAELVGALADALARDALVAARGVAWEKVQAAAARLKAWEAWNASKGEMIEVTSRLKDLKADEGENTELVADLQRQIIANAVTESDHTTKANVLRDGLRRQVGEVQRLNPPPAAWSPDLAGADLSGARLDELVRAYKADWDVQRSSAERFDVLFSDVEGKTAGRYAGTSHGETIARLQDELAALDDHVRNVQSMWSSLVDGMRGAFKALVDGVEEIRHEVSRLTAALGRRQVSNLERIELQLVRQRDMIHKLESVINADESPLFVGPEGRSRAARDIQSWLEDRPQLKLAELFDLRFKVVDAKGQSKVFDSLTQIESEGTGTTIKVLVHLELLRTMLSDDDVTIPFYLDEVATLDVPNLRALIDHAAGMGFVPVIASPDARDCVNTLYFLRPGGGGLVLDETSRLRLHQEPVDGS